MLSIPFLIANVKDFTDHFYHYLSVYMDAEVIVPLLSNQLLNKDVAVTAQSNYHKNCLMLQQVRLMDAKTLLSFCELLRADESHKNIGESLVNGK